MDVSDNVTIGSDKGLGPNRRQAIIQTNYGLIYWHTWPQGVNHSHFNDFFHDSE